MNQKSLDKKKTKELDWEKEFDKNWINPWNRNNFGIPKAHLDIKDFISKTLTQQRTELLEGILEENFCDLDGTYDYDGIAQDVIDLIQK